MTPTEVNPLRCENCVQERPTRICLDCHHIHCDLCTYESWGEPFDDSTEEDWLCANPLCGGDSVPIQR